ncbi:MAG: hypothetical protein EBZ50_06405 [Alphaproteobacteria bacterium]|nr:hypothetical protein [Alphaproteobacteria bacterium]
MIPLHDPLARYVIRPRSYGAATDPVSAVAEAIGAVFQFGAETAGGIIGAKQARDSQIAAVAAVNPCVARVQAKLATLGPKPVFRLTEQQKKEHALRLKLEAELRRLLSDPMACPEVVANKQAQDVQEAANAKATTAYLTIGGVGLVGAGVLVYLAIRKKK